MKCHYTYSDSVPTTRERALDAAVDLLGTQGLRALTHRRVEDPHLVPTADHLVAGAWLVLRRGKKTVAGVEVTPI